MFAVNRITSSCQSRVDSRTMTSYTSRNMASIASASLGGRRQPVRASGSRRREVCYNAHVMKQSCHVTYSRLQGNEMQDEEACCTSFPSDAAAVSCDGAIVVLNPFSPLPIFSPFPSPNPRLSLTPYCPYNNNRFSTTLIDFCHMNTVWLKHSCLSSNTIYSQI